jgi:predicted RNase H-like HicB family nuclease
MGKWAKFRRRLLSGQSDQKIDFDEYEVIIYWSEADNRFIAEMPELPGCMADGTTPREALENTERIAAEWLETASKLGRPIPQPKGRLIYA